MEGIINYGPWVIVVISLLTIIAKLRNNRIDEKKIYNWLKKNTHENQKFRSSKAIMRATNIPIDRIDTLCGRSSRIFNSTGERDGMWTIFEVTDTPLIIM